MGDQRRIMVVPRAKLFLKDAEFLGFCSREQRSYLSAIRQHNYFANKASVEQDASLKQPIGYCVIVNSQEKSIFIYQRCSDEHVDFRLQNKWSLGVGGHVEVVDQGEDPITASVRRELYEEIYMRPKKLIHVGYINFEHDVHAVHFGLLFIAITATKEIIKTNEEIINGSFVSKDEIDGMIRDPLLTIEDWSIIAWKHIQKFLN